MTEHFKFIAFMVVLIVCLLIVLTELYDMEDDL
jgi:hypothetical protein